MANIITTLSLEMSENWYVSKKLNSIGRVGENTVTKLIIEPTEILDGVTYEIEIMSADGSKNVAELTVEDSELYLILTANMLTTSGIMKMQVRGLFTDGSIKKSNIFELKVNRSISATEAYEEYAVIIFDQLVNECRDIIEGAESYAVRAETAAVNAETYSEAASASAQSASEAAQTASTTATTAATSAENSATSATTAASNASTYADNAATSATNASNSAASASTSASNAAVSETNAAASATAANTSASNANTSATNAANSATSAATSATNAHNSEVNASTSETNASTSATEAAASAESIAASVAQINENTYRINDLEAIIAGYQLADLPTGAVASVTDGTALLMPSLKIGIEPQQEGSGDPSPDNVRPISGWTAANVVRTGVNVWDEEWELGIYSVQNGDKLNSLTRIRTKNPIHVIPNMVYNKIAPTNGFQYLLFYDKNMNFIQFIKTQASNQTFTVPANAMFMHSYTENNSYGTTYKHDISINYPSTDTDYHTFNGTTYTIEFKDGDNPLTVYGGTLDVTSGELTVTDAHIASYDSETLPSTWISDRDVYAEGTTPTTGAEVVYKLANSVTYQLTPTQVRTLVGTNNIWADAGNIIEGKYFKSLV